MYGVNAQPKVLTDASLKQVIVEISQKRLGATAVVDADGKLSGIITDGDLRRMLEKNDSLENIVAENILSPDPKTIMPGELAVTALDVLRQFDISQLVVTDENGYYLGMIHIHDLIREGIV